MEQPWGLSGPEFLELYWIALAVSLAFAIAVRVRPRGGDPAGALGLYDIAYLTGGPRRVVETSVASLIDVGALRPARDGTVRVVGRPVADDTVDQAVLHDAARYRNRTLSLLFTSVSEQDASRDIGRRLVERGYLVAPEVVRRRYRVAVVPLALLLAVGVVRWVNGLAIGAPVGRLTLQLVVTGILIGLLLKVRGHTRTAHGSRAVTRARAAGGFLVIGAAGAGGLEVVGAAGAAGLVALEGFAHHPNIALGEAGRRYAAPTVRKPGRWSVRGGTALLGINRASTIHLTGDGYGGAGGHGGGGGSSCGGGGGCGGGGS